MLTFIASLIILILGYIIYGRFTQKIVSPDDRATPAMSINDGVDCVPLKTWKAFLIQLLNIAGTGPIFGALMGATFGPVVFLWIVFGSILGGAVHDYLIGMISERNGGKSVASLCGIYLNDFIKQIVRVFSLLLLLLVGAVFVTSPAALMARLTPDFASKNFWVALILIYYVLATLLPVDKLIGRLYPLFGIALASMAFCIIGSIFFKNGLSIPEISLSSFTPQEPSVWPYMFVTVACGAVSGFHSTQTPMMAKCITSEREGRKVFYGAMICEAVIALIWAAGGMAYYSTSSNLSQALLLMGQSGVVYEMSTGLLGGFGGVIAIVGVVLCPITSGDTAFRSARLILAEWTGLDQKNLKNRLILTLPMLLAGAVLTQLDFDVLWRYFSWSNQTLAMITLWIASSYLSVNSKYQLGFLIAAIPATFMSGVTATYILMAEEGFRLSSTTAYPLGGAFALLCFVLCLYRVKKKRAIKIR